MKSQLYFSLWRSSLCAKGLRQTTSNRNFTSVFGDGTSCRAKRLRFLPSRWHCPAPSREKWKRRRVARAREQEGKRECEDEKMRRCQDVRRWRWEDVKMRRCEDVRMWRWDDVKMSGCKDEKMWGWEDVKKWGCEDEKIWRCGDAKMSRCKDEKMWGWEGVKMRRCEDEKMWRCFTMFYRPPLLEEPCAQTLSGTRPL